MRRMCFAAALMMLLGAWAAAEEVVYAPIQISLWGEPSSGYEWLCEYEDNGVLEAPMQEYVEGENGNAGGNFDFYFGVRAPGRANISFIYDASRGIAAPERRALCTAIVNEDGSNSLRWAECYADDKLLEIVLPSNPTTGWSWSYAGDSAGIVTLQREDYEPLYPDLEGAGGKNTFELRVDAPGQTLLLFNHSSMWDPQAAAMERYVLRLDVDEDMGIGMSIEEDIPGFDIEIPVSEE